MEKEKISAAQHALSYLPERTVAEISSVLRGRRGGESALKEIRLRSVGKGEILVGREYVSLVSRPTQRELEDCVIRLCGGGVYAHKDEIAKGYISIGRGVRVGVAGEAGIDDGRLVGISRVSALVFRIPTGGCDFANEIYSVYKRGIGAGMIIYSPPGGGKTTALRSLASSIGGEGGLSVCVVDERREFCEEDYEGCRVDILRGYEKRAGLEIATRCLSPGLLMIDEIGADDSSAILGALRCGVPIIATAHAKSFEELKKKSSLGEIFARGAFEVAVGILKDRNEYGLRVDKL